MVAGLDKPLREQFKSAADHYNKARKAWYNRELKIDRGRQKILNKYNSTERPQRENSASREEFHNAWMKSNQTNRKGDLASQKLIRTQTAKHEKGQAKMRAKSNGEKKPGIMSKLLGKGKRELAYEWDELEWARSPL